MYDVREGALNATIVGRWEYAPGSTAFLVYSQIPNDEGTTCGLRPALAAARSIAERRAAEAVLAWLR